MEDERPLDNYGTTASELKDFFGINTEYPNDDSPPAASGTNNSTSNPQVQTGATNATTIGNSSGGAVVVADNGVFVIPIPGLNTYITIPLKGNFSLNNVVIDNQGGSIQDIRNKIVQVAENYEGSTAWGFHVAKEMFPAGCNKCNLYVYDVLKKAGASPGLPHVNGTSPPTAADWANPFFKIPGWIVLTSKQAPMPGDIVAVQENYSDATGHVGIVIGPNLTSSFSSITHQVSETDWGFRSDNGGWVTFRRYVGP